MEGENIVNKRPYKVSGFHSFNIVFFFHFGLIYVGLLFYNTLQKYTT